MKNFRRHHLLDIFRESENQRLPFDAFLRDYFRHHKAVGSKDRQEICDTLYGMVRWKALLDHLCKPSPNWERRLDCYLQIAPLDYQNDEAIPLHIRVSFPKFIFDTLKEAYGEKKTVEICLNSNRPAPTTIRVNIAKITREELFSKWDPLYDVSLCKKSPWGIVFHKKINFFALPEFKAGFFEIQDEGSQLVAREVNAAPGDHVMDYCAGSGGKTLGFAPGMKGSGQIHLYDIRPHMLVEAKKRLKRAGIQNGHPLTQKHLKRKGLLKKMDWLLLDVPCSGTGTLRRNPDMKWKITREMIDRLALEQRKIFAETLKFLHPKGKIVYATCSIFPEENERQVAFFIEEYGLKLVKPPFSSLPENGKMDGFFSAILSY